MRSQEATRTSEITGWKSPTRITDRALQRFAGRRRANRSVQDEHTCVAASERNDPDEAEGVIRSAPSPYPLALTTPSEVFLDGGKKPLLAHPIVEGVKPKPMTLAQKTVEPGHGRDSGKHLNQTTTTRCAFASRGPADDALSRCVARTVCTTRRGIERHADIMEPTWRSRADAHLEDGPSIRPRPAPRVLKCGEEHAVLCRAAGVLSRRRTMADPSRLPRQAAWISMAANRCGCIGGLMPLNYHCGKVPEFDATR